MRWLKFAALLQFIVFTHCNSDDTITELSSAIEVLLIKLMEKNHAVFDFIEVSDNVRDGKLIDLQNAVLKTIPPTINLRLDHFRSMRTANMRLRRTVMIYLESIEIFHEFNKRIVSETFDFYGYYIFILYKGRSSDVQVIFDEMWWKYIYNIYVVYVSDNSIDLMTFLPFENKTDCDDTTARVVNMFVNGKFTKPHVFVSKMRSFNGCPLKVTTFADLGNVMKRNVKDNGSYELYGQSVDFLKAVAESMQFKPVIDLVEDKSPWSLRFDNENSVGVFGKLLNKQAHVAFGDWNLKPSRTKHFDTTLTHEFNHLVFIVPPAAQFSSLEKLLLPLHWIVWLLFLVTICIGILVILIISFRYKQLRSFMFGQNVRSPMTNMLIAILGLQQTTLPRTNFARFILVMFLIFCLVMRTVYQGALFEILQSNPTHKEINSLNKLFKRDYTLYTYPVHDDLINASMPELMKNIKHYSVEKSFITRELKETDKMAGLESLKSIAYVNRLNQGKYQRRYCKKTFITVGLVWYVQKNSFLIKNMNRKIEAFLCGGFIQHWTKKYYDLGSINSKERKLQKLNMTQLSGMFEVLIFGYFAALFVFACEVVAARVMRR